MAIQTPRYFDLKITSGADSSAGPPAGPWVLILFSLCLHFTILQSGAVRRHGQCRFYGCQGLLLRLGLWDLTPAMVEALSRPFTGVGKSLWLGLDSSMCDGPWVLLICESLIHRQVYQLATYRHLRAFTFR